MGSKSLHGNAISRTTEYFQNILNVFFLFLVLIPLCSCAPTTSQSLPTLSGTFSGNTPKGTPVKITLEQDRHSITGYGKFGERIFTLSALASWQAKTNFIFGDRTAFPSRITLSPDGKTAVVNTSEGEVVLDRGGEPVQPASGVFTGNFKSRGALSASVQLTQGENLIAGTGFLNGKPIAVSGKTTGAKTARGHILFTDESQNIIQVSLSEDDQLLTVSGVGEPVLMRRE